VAQGSQKILRGIRGSQVTGEDGGLAPNGVPRRTAPLRSS
jgi:hypothetical protein